MRIQSPAPAYDVVIVGGGMVGASFACALGHALSNSKLSILVVESAEQHAPASMQPSFDARSTALSYGSSKIFSGIGLWEKLSKSVTPILEIQVSDKGHFGSARITSAEQGVEALGYVVENHDLGVCLNAQLCDSSTVQLLQPAVIEKAVPTEIGMSLQIAAGGQTCTVTSKLLVLADGGKSPVCRQLGITHREEPYEQQALITNIAFELPHKNIAFERFTDTGPLAVLPLAAVDDLQRGSLVWTLGNDQVAEYLDVREQELVKRLQERFGNRLGKIQHIGNRYCYPLSLSIATEQIRPGLVLLGNVAHTLHPVAGQGLNLALRDARTLVETLLQAHIAGESFGSMQVLQRYLQAQEADQDRAIGFTDFATRLFSSNQGVKILLRKFGLLAIDLIPALRHEFAKQAMGQIHGEIRGVRVKIQ